MEKLIDEGHLARMGPEAWAVFCVFARLDTRNAPVTVSDDTLARLAGLTPETAARALERLAVLGYLVPEGEGWRVRKAYRFVERAQRHARIAEKLGLVLRGIP